MPDQDANSGNYLSELAINVIAVVLVLPLWIVGARLLSAAGVNAAAALFGGFALPLAVSGIGWAVLAAVERRHSASSHRPVPHT